jgi:O-antigen ligase
MLSVALIQVFLQGTLSTLRYQLSNIGTDASSRGRTEDYGPVFDLVQDRPWLGLGEGTFNPRQYFFLDNAWLGALITGGIIGVTALATLLLASLYTAGLARRMTTSPYLADISRALSVALSALAVSAYFFDEFSFPQSATLFFLLAGAIGAAYTWGTPRQETPILPALQRSTSRSSRDDSSA